MPQHALDKHIDKKVAEPLKMVTQELDLPMDPVQQMPVETTELCAAIR